MCELHKRIEQLCKSNGTDITKMCRELSISRSALSELKRGKSQSLSVDKLVKISKYFGITIEYLLGEESEVNILKDYVTFPIVGEVAAGYDHIALEEWTGDTVNIPDSYLKGRRKEEFFVLRVTGNSMYPVYMDGDKVLILKQATLNHSGQVGVVLYNGDTGTLKKVEYAQSEEWIRLVPINPIYQPITIKGEDLENCRILGIPKLLIRDINE